ncbi:MAG TPA: hypothetical protein PL000_19130 [Anaerolineales bacterium]|nr:hypothetical protein [Anaerolineales bacterium]HNJ02625.1 hypothetical protein [Leptospiraceae bacterium]
MEKFDLATVLRGEFLEKGNKKIAQAVRHCKKYSENTQIRKVMLEASIFPEAGTGDIIIQGDVKISLPGMKDSERFILAKKLVEKNGQLTFESKKDPKVSK